MQLHNETLTEDHNYMPFSNGANVSDLESA